MTIDSSSQKQASGAQLDRPLTVVLVISNLEYGGAERQTVELANRLHKFGCATHVVSLSDYTPLADSLNTSVATLHIVKRHAKFDVSVLYRLARLLRRLRADVVHGFLFDAEIFSRIAGKLSGVPVIVGSERNSETLPPLKKRLPYRLTTGLIDVCIANSEAGARDNARIYGMPDDCYRVIRNGVDTERFQPGEATEVRRELDIKPDEFVIAIFGSFKPQKNHGMFIDSAMLFLQSGRRAKFLFVGDVLQDNRRGSKDYAESLSRKVNESGIKEHCIFTGNRIDVHRIYKVCDVVCLTSLHEGTPNVALEALSSGVPVIATDVSDNRKIIQHGETGFIVKLGDHEELTKHQIELHDNRHSLKDMSKAAREAAVRSFSLDRLAELTSDCYRELLAAKRARV